MPYSYQQLVNNLVKIVKVGVWNWRSLSCCVQQSQLNFSWFCIHGNPGKQYQFCLKMSIAWHGLLSQYTFTRSQPPPAEMFRAVGLRQPPREEAGFILATSTANSSCVYLFSVYFVRGGDLFSSYYLIIWVLV